MDEATTTDEIHQWLSDVQSPIQKVFPKTWTIEDVLTAVKTVYGWFQVVYVLNPLYVRLML